MMRALVVAGIIAVGVMGAISFGPASPAVAGTNNTMAIDLDTGTAGIQDTFTAASGSTFDIYIVATGITTPYAGYAWEIEWDAPALQFNSATENSGGHGGVLCAPAGVIDETAGPPGPGVPPAGKEWVGQGAGCLRISGTTSFSLEANPPGNLTTLSITCTQDGTTSVRFVLQAEDPPFFGAYKAEGGANLPTTYVDALLSCGAAVDTPTPTATNTVPPTLTPIPNATNTPCTGSSCNLPPAFTRTNTPIATATPGGPTTPVPGGTAPPPPGGGANPTATRTGGAGGQIGGPDTGSGPSGDGGSALMLSLLASGAGLTLVAAAGWKLRASRNRS
jgi:hypothetical protein